MIPKFLFTYTMRIDGKLSPVRVVKAETKEEFEEKIKKELGLE